MYLDNLLNRLKKETLLQPGENNLRHIMTEFFKLAKADIDKNGYLKIQLQGIHKIVMRCTEDSLHSGSGVNEPTELYVSGSDTVKGFSKRDKDINPFGNNPIRVKFPEKQKVMRNIQRTIHSNDLFSKLLKVTGLPIKFLADEVFELTPKTFSRYKNEPRRIPSLISELAVKILELYQEGIEVFGLKKAFNSWLMEENPIMNNIQPKIYLCT